MQALSITATRLIAIVTLVACSGLASTRPNQAEVVHLVLDSEQVQVCRGEALVVSSAAGPGPYVCLREVPGGRAYLRFDSAGVVGEATRYWDLSAAEAPAALERRRAVLAARLGPAQHCFGRLWVWRGEDWHAILAHRGSDEVGGAYPAEPHAVILVVRPGEDRLCPDDSDAPET